MACDLVSRYLDAFGIDYVPEELAGLVDGVSDDDGLRSYRAAFLANLIIEKVEPLQRALAVAASVRMALAEKQVENARRREKRRVLVEDRDRHRLVLDMLEATLWPTAPRYKRKVADDVRAQIEAIERDLGPPDEDGVKEHQADKAEWELAHQVNALSDDRIKASLRRVVITGAAGALEIVAAPDDPADSIHDAILSAVREHKPGTDQ